MLMQVCEMNIGLPDVGIGYWCIHYMVQVFDLMRGRRAWPPLCCAWQQRAPENFRSFHRKLVPDGFQANEAFRFFTKISKFLPISTSYVL